MASKILMKARSTQKLCQRVLIKFLDKRVEKFIIKIRS